MSLTISTPITAADVRNFGCSFMTKRSKRFLLQFCTARRMSTVRPVLEMPVAGVSSLLLTTSSISVCGLLAELGGRAVISTAEIDSLVWRLFFTAYLRWEVAGALGMVMKWEGW